MNECWRPVIGYAGRYEVSSLGRVRSAVDKIVGQWLKDDGYRLVRLSKPRAVLRVHVLVAEAFIPNPSSLPAVNHIDHNRANNDANNLEWCTQAHNLAHARAAGRMYSHPMGRRSPNAAVSDDAAALIRSEYAAGNVSWEDLAKRHGISKRAIGRIIRGETYV